MSDERHEGYPSQRFGWLDKEADQIVRFNQSEEGGMLASVESTATTEASDILEGLRTEPEEAATTIEGGQWVADPLALEATMTRDGRIFDEGALYWNKGGEMSLMAQTTVPESGGHAGAFLAGSMPGRDVKRAANIITARGPFNTDEDGQRAEEFVRNRSLTGISIDIAPQEWQIELAPEEGGGILLFSKDELTEEEGDDGEPIIIEKSVDDMTIRFKKAEIIGATLVATPAFGETQVSLAASTSGYPIPKLVTVTGYVRMADELPALGASIVTKSVEELERYLATLQRAEAVGYITEREARSAFQTAMMRHVQ